MKKLAYIILVIAILLLISHFVKNGITVTETPAVAEESVAEVSASAIPASETTLPSEDSDVVEVQETAEDIIISDEAPEDEGAIDVVETSEATMDEEETVLPE